MGRDGDWEFESSGRKLLYLGWINKVLQFSTGDWAQECVYRYHRIPLLYSTDEPNIVSQLYFNKTHFQKMIKNQSFSFRWSPVNQISLLFIYSLFSH